MSAATALSSSEFEAKVINSTKPVLIDFWAEWCGPCRALGPHVDAIAQEYSGKVDVYKVDIEQDGDLATNFGVLSIPMLIFFKGGKEVDRITGLVPKEHIAKALDRVLA